MTETTASRALRPHLVAAERGVASLFRRRRPAAFWIALALLVPVALAALAPGLNSTYDPFANSGPALSAPSLAHPFGTDDLGRDLLVQWRRAHAPLWASLFW